MAAACWARVAPVAAQFARGAGLGAGVASLAGGNLALSVAVSRRIDANGHPETPEARDSADVYAATAALVATRFVLTCAALHPAARVGMSIPAAAGAGAGAGWFHEKAGPPFRAVAGALGLWQG